MMRVIKKSHPSMNIKAFTAAEIFYLSKLTKNSVKEILSRLKDAGLDSLPGGGAEIFDDTIRNRIIRGKCTGQEWLDTVETAHNCIMPPVQVFFHTLPNILKCYPKLQQEEYVRLP